MKKKKAMLTPGENKKVRKEIITVYNLSQHKQYLPSDNKVTYKTVI